MIVRPKRVHGQAVLPARNRNIELIRLKGKGVFVSLTVVKVGGSNDFSGISMDIDGQNVASLLYVAAINSGLDSPNNSGTVLTYGTIAKTITIQFNQPLYFNRSFKVQFSTGTDANINNINADAIIGEFVANPDDSIGNLPTETTTGRARKRK